MNKISSLFILAGVAFATAPACNAATTYSQMRWVSDPQSFISYGAAGRDLRIDVLGNPFTSAAGDLGQAVATGMQKANVGPGTRFAVLPGSSAMPDFRVVVTFDRTVNAADLCALTAASRRSATIGGGGGEITATLCDKEKPITSTSGSLVGIAAASDPAFGDLLKFMALDLFPGPLPWRG